MTRGSRYLVALAMLLFIGGLMLLDVATSAAPNPFQAPPMVALGSGQASGGAHCASLPSD